MLAAVDGQNELCGARLERLGVLQFHLVRTDPGEGDDAAVQPERQPDLSRVGISG